MEPGRPYKCQNCGQELISSRTGLVCYNCTTDDGKEPGKFGTIHPNKKKDPDIRKWEKECLTKSRIREASHAKEIAKTSGLDYYICPNCGYFHMTSLKEHSRRFKIIRVVN